MEKVTKLTKICGKIAPLNGTKKHNIGHLNKNRKYQLGSQTALPSPAGAGSSRKLPPHTMVLIPHTLMLMLPPASSSCPWEGQCKPTTSR